MSVKSGEILAIKYIQPQEVDLVKKKPSCSCINKKLQQRFIFRQLQYQPQPSAPTGTIANQNH